MNSSYLSSLLKKETGMTISYYVNRQKIQYAAKMLINPSISISSVAQKVGIIDTNYFSRLFKQYMGISPMAYRKSKKRST